MARRSGKKIETVRWTGDTVINTAALASGGSAAIQLYQVGDQEAAPTLLRTRGQISVYVDGVQAPGGSSLVTLGVHVVPKGSDATITSTPLTEAEGDWFVWRTAVLAYEEMVTDVIAVERMLSFRFEIDSKAMRKMKPGQEIQFVVASITNLAGGVAINVAGQLRFLLGT